MRVFAPFRVFKLNVQIAGAASFTIYSGTKESFRNHNILCRDSIIDTSLTGGVSGAMSGALISFGSARMSLASSAVMLCYVLLCLPAFELVKVKHCLLFNFSNINQKFHRFVDNWNIPLLQAKAFPW